MLIERGFGEIKRYLWKMVRVLRGIGNIIKLVDAL
jgi:hypothetical protein